MATNNSCDYVPTQYNTQTGGASGTLNNVSPGSSGQVLTSNGASSQPTFQSSGLIVAVTELNHASSTYVVLSTDYFLSCDTSGGVLTINFPNAPATGRVYVIKDKTGSALASNITLTTVGGSVTLDGATSYVMNANYQSVSLLFNGTVYEIF